MPTLIFDLRMSFLTFDRKLDETGATDVTPLEGETTDRFM